MVEENGSGCSRPRSLFTSEKPLPAFCLSVSEFLPLSTFCSCSVSLHHLNSTCPPDYKHSVCIELMVYHENAFCLKALML